MYTELTERLFTLLCDCAQSLYVRALGYLVLFNIPKRFVKLMGSTKKVHLL